MKTVHPDASFSQLEQETLEFWQKQDIFAKQNEQRKNNAEFAFYDGPPFANGLPHYGHLLANTIKDAVPRYWIMKGYKVDRRFGWDCHGLPVEFEIEKREKLKGRPDILALGVDKFNEMCRESITHFAAQWQKTITRLGRFVDWQRQYRTMDKAFMESVWWVFKQLYDKGLIYQGHKVVPYSPRTSSVVSNFEANQNYKDTQDPAITVKVKLAEEKDTYFLIWTTTPWTLPANLGLAVHKDLEYVSLKIAKSNEIWILAKDLVDDLMAKLAKEQKEKVEYTILQTTQGASLAGKKYCPLFPYYKDHPKAFKVICADFVQSNEGTGIVHLAPAFGEDDFFALKDLELVDPIDDSGCFKEIAKEYQGQYFKDADKNIIKDLKGKNLLLLHNTIVHSYPFDERTDTPLMYKAVPSWYVAVEQLNEKLVANNQKINWVPAHLKDGRMGNWLQNARDWSISRNRFWGTPIPVWICSADEQHIKALGSAGELEKITGQKIEDLHIHFISKHTFPCDKCGGTMKIIGPVFDCWFESGSMPYAQLHYPFANEKRFADIFPADFIGEGLDQTRGWFYTLTVLSTALFDQPAFKNVIVNGVILDENGKKMSKRHKNYTPPDLLMERYGADSVRLYMLNHQLLRAENLIFSDQGVKDITRAVLIPLWNAYSFLSTYANAEGYKGSLQLDTKIELNENSHFMDRWIVSKLQSLLAGIETHMLQYKLYLVVPSLLEFIEDLTNWYIRISRRRFWGETSKEAKGSLDEGQYAAFDTLFHILAQFSKVFAPFAPFLADTIYRNLDLNKESVHLCDFPESQKSLTDTKLEQQVETIRLVTNLARSLRQKHKLKVRQVLPQILVITKNPEDKNAIMLGSDILLSEINVKKIEFTTKEEEHVRLQVKPNLPLLGKKLGKDLGKLRAHLDSLNLEHKKVSEFLSNLEGHGSYLFLDYELKFEEFLIERGPLDDRLIATQQGVTVLLDTKLSEELISEGLAREIVNRIQNLRKDANLNVSDRIMLHFKAEKVLVQAALANKEYILKETLGATIHVSDEHIDWEPKASQEFDIDGMPCIIGLKIAQTSRL